MELKAGFVCDRGLNPKRPVNQDRFLAVPERGLFAVFDGVGGQRAGEVASQTAADTVEEAITHTSAGSSAELVKQAIRFANRDVFELAESDPSYKTMATTVALLHVDGNHATIAHVGDSRVYRLESGRLFRETVDHTDFNDAVRAGLLHRGDAPQLSAGNVINRALGVDRNVDVEIKSLRVHDGERFLLCSDGIYRHLSDEEIARVLAANKDPQLAADELKKIVHQRGADDNLTAVVVQVGRARKGPVLSVDDGLVTGEARSARSFAPEVSTVPAGRGRIEVDFEHSHRHTSKQPRGFDENAEKRFSAAKTDGETGRQTSRMLLVLVVLVLMAASFYGGLRASDWLKARTSRRSIDSVEQVDAARQQLEKGDVATAETSLASIVSRDPQNAKAFYWLGRSQLELGRFRESAASFEQAIRLDPRMADAYVQASAVYEILGDKARSSALLAQFAELKKAQGAAQSSSLR
jgi:serine/threonine protein phosphatase PrpC/Tfp pilus assembly protein PilF